MVAKAPRHPPFEQVFFFKFLFMVIPPKASLRPGSAGNFIRGSSALLHFLATAGSRTKVHRRGHRKFPFMGKAAIIADTLSSLISA